MSILLCDLYIVKKIMEAHDGRVWAESDGEGKGAEFYVELDWIQKKQ